MTQQALRILVVLPMYGGSLPMGRYCAAALSAAGHSVRVFEAPLMHAAFTGLQGLALTPAHTAQLENSFLQTLGQAVWAQTQTFEPQLVLALAQAPMSRALLQRLRRSGVRTAMWFVEDYRIFHYWRTYAPLYDVFAVIQKEPFLSELAAVGQPHALYLPAAALPDFHTPMTLSPAEQREYGSALSFMGAGYPNRRAAFRSLAGQDFKIWGSDWEGEGVLAGNIQRKGARISEEESVKIYNAAQINLNLHSSLAADAAVGHGDFVNPRTFELAALGGFQLVDERSLMPELFGPDELATFTTLEELQQKIHYFLSRPEERAQYAARAQKRALAEHTYAHRMATLLDYLEQSFGPWAESSVAASPSPELDAASAALLRNLGLGPHASFEDVTAQLRARSGALGEAETALLFLDEWRKQYQK